MKKPVFINGFSQMNQQERLKSMLSEQDFSRINLFLRQFSPDDQQMQELFQSFSENTIANYHLPFGVAPNFVIDGRLFHIPMVMEESSVVAAASRSAKFWADKGGFQTVSIKQVKVGQIHFSFDGGFALLYQHFPEIKRRLQNSVASLTERMQGRGGGLLDIELQDITRDIADYYQLFVTFKTADSMGANFINSCLEAMAAELREIFREKKDLSAHSSDIIMAILSNYTPESIIRMKVETGLDMLDDISPGMSGAHFAERFYRAVEIAQKDIYRATTHNKGIMNGVDAVVIATGNDFRAVEAAAHAYAARDGRYASLSTCTVENGIFRYELELPLSVGTVGGLTNLHPLAAFSIEFLGKPGAEQLMKIVAAAGLANNFGAVRALVTEGIQKGHMKLHLDNILSQYQATAEEKKRAKTYFYNKTVSNAAVKKFLDAQRS